MLDPWESNASAELKWRHESDYCAFFDDLDEMLPTKDVGLNILGITITSRSFVVFRDVDIFVQDESVYNYPDCPHYLFANFRYLRN